MDSKLMILNVPLPTEVDEKYFDLLSGFNFYLCNWGYLVFANGPHEGKCLHTFIAEREGMDTSNKIDHKDRNKLNNKSSNLRPATQSQNIFNRPLQSNNNSGYSGVSYFPRDGNWRVRIKVNNKERHIGYFDTFDEAVVARKKAEMEHFGEFANGN